MPTGYTAPIEDGSITTLGQYALRCARAFGALIHMRDENLDVQIEPRIADTEYHDRRLMEARQRLADLERLTPQEADRKAQETFERDAESYERSLAEIELKNNRYAAMRAQVEGWAPPTSEHVKFKEFMLSQIDLCVDSYVPQPPTLWTADEWLHDQLCNARDDLDYHEQRRREEIERAADSNRWVQQLVESL